MPMKWQADGSPNPLTMNRALFDAALDEFSERSFRDASLNNILKNAGMNKGSFYYRFYDKMDIYLSLVQCMGEEKIAFLKQNEPQNIGVGFFDGLRQSAVTGLLFAKKHPKYNLFWKRILVEEQGVKELINDCFGGLADNVMAEAVERGKASGELRVDIPTGLLASVVTTLLYRMDSLISPELGDGEILSRVDSLLALVKDGVRRVNP